MLTWLTPLTQHVSQCFSDNHEKGNSRNIMNTSINVVLLVTMVTNNPNNLLPEDGSIWNMYIRSGNILSILSILDIRMIPIDYCYMHYALTAIINYLLKFNKD